ncbi:hypothetical protein ACFP2T_40165 [Plantactinospora solaniradicis]|uniref:LPXTG cell wall anchor domain-containing protein n=1 Tax=Plantactinospora solaniradicis TaxID=1723736 RepID=A0ABW1KLE2_9ACTN
MSSKLLGKVLAGAGLGAASLLICTPGTALADGGGPGHEYDKGHIYTEPKGVKPGHKFKIYLECEHPVRKPWVSSKITGKIWLKPVEENGEREPGRPEEPDDNGQPEDPGQPSQPPGNGQPTPPPNDEQPGQPGLPEDGQPALPEDEQPQAGDEEGQGGEGGQAAYGNEHEYWAWAKVPSKTKPGHYAAKGSCDGKGKIVVLPNGSVSGGDGGVSTDTSRTAAGASLLGAAALGGFLMVRRRRTDGSLA